MRELSSALVLATVCALGINSAPTSAPSSQKHMASSMEVLRLPQYQTACIVDVIQNNTDPDTHIVSRDVEVLLTKCFIFPVPQCPDDNPGCAAPQGASTRQKETMDATEETARDDETTQDSARAEGIPQSTVASIRLGEGPTSTEASGRADVLAPEQARKRTTTEAPDDDSTGASGRADVLAPEQAKKRTTTEAPGDDSSEASGRADEDSTTAVVPARGDDVSTTAAPSGRVDETPTTVTSSSRAEDVPTTAAPSGRAADIPTTAATSDRADEDPTTVASSARAAEDPTTVATSGRSARIPHIPTTAGPTDLRVHTTSPSTTAAPPRAPLEQLSKERLPSAALPQTTVTPAQGDETGPTTQPTTQPNIQPSARPEDLTEKS